MEWKGEINFRIFVFFRVFVVNLTTKIRSSY